MRSPFILNGVCVRWRGWLDLERLDGVGCLEFDEESALLEDAKLREQVEENRAFKSCATVPLMKYKNGVFSSELN